MRCDQVNWEIEERKEKDRLLKAKKDIKRKEAIDKRIKRRQDMQKNKKKIKKINIKLFNLQFICCMY